MSRTACCFLALGISVAAFSAACGDDDGGGGGTGGNGGSGASGGSGGGTAGTAGAAGSGTAGTSGGGAAGQGTAGTGNAGTAGNAGSGSSGAAGSGPGPSDPDAGDSGVVEEPDSGVGEPVDSGGGNPPLADGGVNGDCDFGAAAATLEAANGQDYVISKVIFEGTTAHVTLRTIIAQSFADPQRLCSGPTDAECVEVIDDVEGDRPPGTQLDVDVPDVDIAGGELAFLSNVPSADGVFALAYVNWGDFVSVDPDAAGPQVSLEDLAVLGTGNDEFWTDGNSITLDGNDNTIFAEGNVTVETGFGGCTVTTF
jgi:hypothetical protein